MDAKARAEQAKADGKARLEQAQADADEYNAAMAKCRAATVVGRAKAAARADAEEAARAKPLETVLETLTRIEALAEDAAHLAEASEREAKINSSEHGDQGATRARDLYETVRVVSEGSHTVLEAIRAFRQLYS